MEDKRYCECGCGGELKSWQNGGSSPFLRGHHMRKKGWTPPPAEKHYCECGCGTKIEPLKNGHIRRYVKGHHLKGKTLDLTYRIERTKKRWGSATLSPFLPETFVKYHKPMGRWVACIRSENGTCKGVMHANAVYRHHCGEIPKGWVVHHRDGRHTRLEDDRPENLLLLPDEWNLRFFPVLAKGFDVDEQQITDTYLDIISNGHPENELFVRLCEAIIEQKKRESDAIDKARKQKH